MSKTEENLKTAFAGESQARNKYTYFSKVARNEGYHLIARIFEETADNEKEHAKVEFKLLNGIGDTITNLKELGLLQEKNHEISLTYSGTLFTEELCTLFIPSTTKNNLKGLKGEYDRFYRL